MAFTLIELLRKPFDPEEYQDHYREALQQLIEAKLEGREVVKSPAREGDQGHRSGRRAQAKRRGRRRRASRSAPAASRATRASGTARRRGKSAEARAPAADPRSPAAVARRREAARRGAGDRDHPARGRTRAPRHQPGQGAVARRRPHAPAAHQARPAALSRAGRRRWMLPHLADRPLFVTRFPDGITGKSFYQKHWERSAAVRPHGARSTPATTSATATISSARTSRRCSGWARWRASSCTPGTRRTDPAPDAAARGRTLHRLGGGAGALGAQLPRLRRLRPRPLRLLGQRGARARSRSCTGAPSIAPAGSRFRCGSMLERPRPRHLRQDLGPDRTPPLSADRARPRLRRRPRRRGDDRPARAARAAARR